MRIQIINDKNEVKEATDIKYILCEDEKGGRYTIYAKGHSLIVEQPEYNNKQVVTMMTDNQRRAVLSGMRNIKELLGHLEELI